MISAGRVLLMPKGDYDPAVIYEMLDIVSYNGSSYIAKSTTTGNLPTNTTYWQLSAYGGQASNLAGNFAPLETTEYATRAYVVDDIFVDKDSQLLIATTTINIGDEIEIGSNCDATTISELLDAIKNRYDALDQRNRKLVGINPITIQTDLHLLAPGEYFKKLTNFYVTNAPTGINQVPTAVFRLTVESGLDENGSSLLLTLKTIEGEIYTQAYDGSIWSDWRKAGNVDNSDLGTAAVKNSTNAVTEDSTALVESGAVFDVIKAEATLRANADNIFIAEIADMNNVLGAKNLLPNIGVGTSTNNGITYTKNSDGSVTANGTATGWAYYNLCSRFTLDAGTYILSGKEAKAATQIKLLNADTQADIALLVDNNTETQFTLNTKTTLHAMLYIGVDAGTVTDFVFYPMLRLASIADDTYEPYSMTNREMTPYVQAISNPNLLDNPWFTVNQRGQNSYIPNHGNYYTVDRWGIENASSGDAELTVNADGSITFTNNSSSETRFFSIQSNKQEFGIVNVGDIYTISINVLSYSGTCSVLAGLENSSPFLNWGSFTVSKTGINSKVCTVPVSYNQGNSFRPCTLILSAGASITIKAVKLERGSVSTLAIDTAPNYEQELAKCQRFFVRNGSASDVRSIGVGQAISATACMIVVPLPVTLRTGVSHRITVNDYPKIQLRNGGVYKDATNVTIDASGVGVQSILVESTGLTIGACYDCFIKSGGALDISADF